MISNKPLALDIILCSYMQSSPIALHQDVVSDVNTTSIVHEGTTITLGCLSGLVLAGSNTSTCMGNGQWEPDPREVECMRLG